MKSLLKSLLERVGYRLNRIEPPPNSWSAFSDLSPQEQAIMESVRPFTMTGLERLTALIEAVKYIVRNRIDGDIVECGVWRGGSMMTVARTLLMLNDTSRRLYLYDTFEGMAAPTEKDADLLGRPATDLLREETRQPGHGVWAYATLEDVRQNVLSTGYPADHVSFVAGKVEDTIPQTISPQIALLRLDTDWYASTRHELEHLYPRLNQHGVMIIDDYGHWRGAREATDEFLRALPYPLYLHRIDYTARAAVKPSAGPKPASLA